MRRLLLSLFILAISISADPLLIITKTPFEVFNCSVDFAQAVGTDSITLVSVTSVNVATKADSSATIIAASPTPAIVPMTDKVVFAVQGGITGETHLVSVRISDTTTGEKFEGQIRLQVNAGR